MIIVANVDVVVAVDVVVVDTDVVVVIDGAVMGPNNE